MTFILSLLTMKWLSWIPMVLKAIWTGISYFFRGLSFLQNPFEMFTVAVLLLFAFGFGVTAGKKWDAHLVKQAQLELTNVYQSMSKQDHADAQKAAAAELARREAEEAERVRQAQRPAPLTLVIPPAAGAATSSHPAVVAGVRDKPAKVRRRICQQGLFGCL